MQYDWSEYTVSFGLEKIKVYLHSLIFGYSRKKFLDVSLNITQGTIFTILQESFKEAGGICRRIQVDNAKQFVSNPSRNNFKWNEAFLNFCGYYGIEATRSRPYYPESKGKVEKPFDFIEHHFIKNNNFDSFEDFYFKLKRFQEEFNNLYHSTIKGVPNQFFERERELLISLPEKELFLSSFLESRKVTSDCLISYNGNRYSVPHYFSGKDAWVTTYKGIKLYIYSQTKKLIAEHTIPKNKGNIVINKSHYKNYNNMVEESSFDSLSHRFLEHFSMFNDKDLFLDRIKNKKGLNPKYHLRHILSLFGYYDTLSCISVMQECIKYDIFNYHFVKGELQKYSLKEDSLSLTIKTTQIPSKNVKRSLQEYAYAKD
ncbi:Mu transposase domain-containing protein [Thermodesulfobium narugense]|uniref:Mu transposase domain-containing protein n=1 Tax=Thermodesulfobium narugense TaxID=184064 RepID=UPI00031EA17D|nr:DDE-type integrase/transposase/recombinase [Thermodesulfobium narugense]